MMSDIDMPTIVLIGNSTRTVGPQKYQWTLFVENYDEAIKRVDVFLHPSFANNHIVLEKEPFSLTRTGWGTFDIKLKVKFVDGQVKEYVHELDFDDETPSIKEYSLIVKDLPCIPVMQCESSDPSLLPPMERKLYYLKQEKKQYQKHLEEEKERKKSTGYKNLLFLRYYYYKMLHTKGNRTTYHKMKIERGLMKHNKYTAICGNKSWSNQGTKAIDGEKQEKILKFVMEKFEGMTENRELKQQDHPLKLKKHMKSQLPQIDFEMKDGKGFDICSRNMKEGSDIHSKICEVIQFIENLME